MIFWPRILCLQDVLVFPPEDPVSKPKWNEALMGSTLKDLGGWFRVLGVGDDLQPPGTPDFCGGLLSSVEATFLSCCARGNTSMIWRNTANCRRERLCPRTHPSRKKDFTRVEFCF